MMASTTPGLQGASNRLQLAGWACCRREATSTDPNSCLPFV